MSMPTGIGVVDLGTGFPHSSVAQKKATYDFFRANLKDRESLEEMEFPAEYMFKDVPEKRLRDVDDPIALTLAEMDHWGIEKGLVGWPDPKATGSRPSRHTPIDSFPPLAPTPTTA